MKAKNIILFSILIILSSSCDNRNLMRYYYPTDKDWVKVYKYADPNEENSVEYWKITISKDYNTILTESFDENFVLYTDLSQAKDFEN